MNDERAQLIDEVLELERDMYRLLRPIVPKEWLRINLTMPQLKVLLFLFTDGPARMGVLASALGVSMTTTTGIIDRLVQQRLLVRRSNSEDRRTVICDLSAKGRELITRLWEQRQVQIRNLLKKIELPELRIVSTELKAILNAAKSAEAVSKH